jgi:hypothetical protein
MKSKLLRWKARRAARRGVGGLKKFAPKFSSFSERQARRARFLLLTSKRTRGILSKSSKLNTRYKRMALSKHEYNVGDLVNVKGSWRFGGCQMVGAIVMRQARRRPFLYTVYYKGKKWPNIHQDEMSPCAAEDKT